MKKLFFLLLLLPVLISCEEEIVDPRDAFAGMWDMEVTGNMLIDDSQSTLQIRKSTILLLIFNFTTHEQKKILSLLLEKK